MTSGPGSLFFPLNGYLVVVPRLISLTALSLSPDYYPEIGTLLTWCFIVAVGMAIAFAPVVVRGGPLLAIAVMVVPSDPEVFGVPLYTLWWAGLLALVAVLWRPGRGELILRVLFVTLGSLSSPLGLLTLPILVGRAVVYRRDIREFVIAVAAACCIGVQAVVIAGQHVAESHTAFSVANALTAFVKFAGSYACGWIVRFWPVISGPALIAGALATVALFVVAVGSRRTTSGTLFLLAYLWCGAVALSVARVNVGAPDPFFAGPRYFFYPFVFEGWLLVHIIITSQRAVTGRIAAVGLIVAAIGAASAPRRAHDDLAWRANLANCATVSGAARYAVPLEFDGHASSAWAVQLTGDRCRAMISGDLLVRIAPALASPPLPYVLAPDVILRAEQRLASPSAVVSNGWNGSDFARSDPAGFAVVGSYRTGDADLGTLRLRLRRGEAVVFRSGPAPYHQRIVVENYDKFGTAAPFAPAWTVLRFSSADLPPRFVVRFQDDGSAWGEWSAVALLAQRATERDRK